MSDVPPIPDDFAPALQETANAVLWRGKIMVDGQKVEIETGFPKSDPDAHAKTKASVWRIQHHADRGEHHLLKWARRDRHQGKRPIDLPKINIETPRGADPA